METYLVDPDGDGAGELIAGADPDGAAPADCTEARIGMTGSSCRFIQSFFIDHESDYLAYVPPGFGVCTGAYGTLGDCTYYSREWFLELYNDFIEEGGTPDGWGTELVSRCAAEPERCANGCITVDTLNALEAAYCATPANATRPTCVSELGTRTVARALDHDWAARLRH